MEESVLPRIHTEKCTSARVAGTWRVRELVGSQGATEVTLMTLGKRLGSTWTHEGGSLPSSVVRKPQVTCPARGRKCPASLAALVAVWTC